MKITTLAVVSSTLFAVPFANAAAVAFYTDSGFVAMGNANGWGGTNKTTSSVIFEARIDFTVTTDAATLPFTIFELGADAQGSGIAIDGDDIIFAIGGGSVANTTFATGAHGLVGGQTDVQILAVVEFDAGTDTNELLSVYVNGVLVATADSPTENDWAGVNTSNLRTTDSFNIFEFVPSINPNAGDNANGVFAGNYPDVDTTITFAAYELSVGYNTVENLFQSVPTADLQLAITPSVTTSRAYDFSWPSSDSKAYSIVSSIDLMTPPSTWDVWEGNENVAGTAGTTTLTDVPGSSDRARFFAVIESDQL